MPRHARLDEPPGLMITGLAVNEPIVGSGAPIVNVPELLPPGVVIVTVRGPGVALASITKAAVSDRPVAATRGPLTFAMVMPQPLTAIVVEPGTNPVPDNVTLTVVPRVPDDGLIDVSVGPGAPTLNVCALVVPPAVVTVTLRAPRSAAASTVNRAVIDVPLTTVTSLVLTPLPDTATVAPLRNPDPVKVAITLLPASALFGVMLFNAGAAAVTVKVTDAPAPDAVVIVNVRVPRAASAAMVTVAVAVVVFCTATLVTVMPLPLSVAVGVPPTTKFVPVIVIGKIAP
jgi:hypothetical protein